MLDFGIALSDLMLIIIIVNFVLIILMLFWEKTDPKSVLMWFLVFLFLPLIGFILYLFVGQTFYSRYVFIPKGVNDELLASVYSKEEKAMERSIAADPKNKEDIELAYSIKNAGGWIYSSNNDIKLYTLGQDKFDDFYKDLKNAKKFIHLEYYIIRNDELGNELLHILTDKVKEGLEVKLLTDAFGNGKGPKKAILEFKKAGGEFALFHNVVTLLFSPKKNNRNHRKIAVIDSEVAYCGGFNVGDEYLGKGPLGFWRDSAVRICGAGIMPIELRFTADWRYAADKEFGITDEHFPDSLFEHRGNDRMQLVSGGPDVMENPVKMQYLLLMRTAKKTLYLHTPYLAPNNSLADALKVAAMSGVDVKIIMPDKPDHLFVYWNNISAANDLMKNGIRVYMYHRGFVHSKTIVVDEKYCSIGSANLDERSMVLNFETNAMIYSGRIGKEMNDAFMKDLTYCTEYSCEEYNKRTTGMKFKIGISKLFKGLA